MNKQKLSNILSISGAGVFIVCIMAYILTGNLAFLYPSLIGTAGMATGLSLKIAQDANALNKFKSSKDITQNFDYEVEVEKEKEVQKNQELTEKPITKSNNKSLNIEKEM